MLGVNKLKWTRMKPLPIGLHEVFCSGNDKLMRKRAAIILRQDGARAVRGHAARFDWITPNRLVGNPHSHYHNLCADYRVWRRWSWKLLCKYSRRNLSHTKTRHADNYRWLEHHSRKFKKKIKCHQKFGLGFGNEPRNQCMYLYKANNLSIKIHASNNQTENSINGHHQMSKKEIK